MTKWKLVVLPLVILSFALTACPPKQVPQIQEAGASIAAARAAARTAGGTDCAPTKFRAAEEALAAAESARRNRRYAEAVTQAELAKKLGDEARQQCLEAAAAQPPPTTEPTETTPTHVPEEAAGYGDIFKNVYFDFDRSDVKGEFRPDLDNAADHLKSHQNLSVVVTGHCDPRGTDEYNMALGERRARSVKRYLTNSGVSSSRVRVISKGESALLDPSCQSESCWWEERRAVFEVEE